MTPPSLAEVAALRERLSRGFEDAGEFTVVVDKTDLRSALALLDAQAADLARLTAERDAALEREARLREVVESDRASLIECSMVGGELPALDEPTRHGLEEYDRALAPAPAAEVAG